MTTTSGNLEQMFCVGDRLADLRLPHHVSSGAGGVIAPKATTAQSIAMNKSTERYFKRWWLRRARLTSAIICWLIGPARLAHAQDLSIIGNWTWVSGSNTVNQAGSYGPVGVVAAGYVPAARCAHSFAIDSGRRAVYLFGGYNGGTQ